MNNIKKCNIIYLTMKDINLIVATSINYGIGYDNKMCWNIPDELKSFKKITTTVDDEKKKNCVIMGKNTWFSLPKAPLKDRINIVISNNNYDTLTKTIGSDEVIVLKSINDALLYININENIENAFIIGGAQLYNDFLDNYIEHIKYVYMSVVIDKQYECDKFISSNIIFNNFAFKKNIAQQNHRYISMIGKNKYDYKIIDEDPD